MFDLEDDLRDKLRLSVDADTDSRERKEDVAEEKVLVLELFPKIELLFICSVYARIRSGEGGPSMAGSSDAVESTSSSGWDWGVSRLGFFLTDAWLYIVGYAALPTEYPNILIAGARLVRREKGDVRKVVYLYSSYAAHRVGP